MKRIPCITINTDASYYEGAGGFAFYIVCDLFKIQKGGMFKKSQNSPLVCEAMAIGNAFATLLAQKELPEVGIIVINTDCKLAIKNISSSKKEPYKQINAMMGRLRTRCNAKISFRHVKAHNGTPDARSWVNDWCDKEAKKWRKLHAQAIKQ